MSDGSAREALDGLIGAVSTESGEDCPLWVHAYRQIWVDEVVDSHLIGLTVGRARAGDHAHGTRWMSALEGMTDTGDHGWALNALWKAALGEPMPSPAPSQDPMMWRVHTAIHAWGLEEAQDRVRAMEARRTLYAALPAEASTHRVACGLEIVADLLILGRITDATALLDALRAPVEQLEDPALTAEFIEREADRARDVDDSERARTLYEDAANAAQAVTNHYGRVDPVIATAHHLIQQGRFRAAREHLEAGEWDDTHPFAPWHHQRRLATLCHLYTTVEDKRALYDVLSAMVESAIATQWTIFGSIGSHVDDLVNLACQFGEEQVAVDALARGAAAVGDDPGHGWLAVAAARLAVWQRRETEAEDALSRAMSDPALAVDLLYCQTVTTMVATHGTDAQTEAVADAVDRCIAWLLDHEEHHRASAGLYFKAQQLAQRGEHDAARDHFRKGVHVLLSEGRHDAQASEAAMEWASWEIGHGRLDRLEEPIGLVIDHSEPPATSALLARLSLEQAMFFAMNPATGESEEDPKAVVGRWIARSADQFLEGERIADANGVYIHLADWLDSQGEYDAATAILELVNEGAVATGDTGLMWRAATVLATRMEQLGLGDDAITLLAETLPTCASDDPAMLGAQHFELASLLNLAGRGEEALPHQDIAVDGLEDGSVRDRARVRMSRGTSRWQAEREADAISDWREALALANRTADRDLVAELGQRIDTLLLERCDRVQTERMAFLEAIVQMGKERRWELVANGSDLPLRWAEALARNGEGAEDVEEAVRTLLDLAEAVTTMGLAHDGTTLMQRATGIEMLRGHHEAGLSLMRQVLDRVEATAGRVMRAREGLMQAALLAAGGLIHESWDRLSEVREWLATVSEGEDDEEAMDELTLTCQLQCAGLHLLADRPEEVVGPLAELIATCDSRDTMWPATQSARITLAAALTALGHAEEAATQVMAIEANLEESTVGWFNGVVLAGRLGQRALGEALISGANEAFQASNALHSSATGIALEACADWLSFTSGQPIDRDKSEALATRALDAQDFELATILRLMVSCYAADAGDTAGAAREVSTALEIARHHWTMDEFGLMWGVLLPPDLKRVAASLLEADRLQHVN